MAINFDTLPQENPFALPEPGVYKAKIVEAEMKQGRDLSKPEYLNLKFSLTDKDGKNCGILYDIIAESDNSVVQYKTARFIRACGLPLTGSMELRDLAKIVKGKEIAVDVSHDTKGERPRAQVDLFSREAYYLASEFMDIYMLVHPEEAEKAAFQQANTSNNTDAEIPFDAVDGAAISRRTVY